MSAQETLQQLDNAKFGRSHFQTILVAGSGFFVDSYDNFIIGIIVPMIAYSYFGTSALDKDSDGWLKAASAYGNMFDVFGRKKMYGIELIILISGALGCALAAWPMGSLSIVGSLTIWRFFLGVGVGGDYPVSAVLASEFGNSKNRGAMIATVFAMQGLGILTGAVASIITLAAFKQSILANGASELEYVWRILAGFGAVPAFAAVYFRLTIPESPRYAIDVLNDQTRASEATNAYLERSDLSRVNAIDAGKQTSSTFAAYKFAFTTYFSKWVNLKVLLGCALTWFFLDIGYYGTSLNTSLVLQFIGYGSGKIKKPTNSDIFEDLWARAVGTAIINIAGTVPGYWFTVAFVDKWGRKPIQYMGFVLLTLLFLFMGIFYTQLTQKGADHTAFVVMYALAQFFFNFGPNATTFIIPAECFPTVVRSTGHGISAASGKLGAILAAQLFSRLTENIGFQGVLYIFSGCCFLGLVFTLWVPETNQLSLEELSDGSGLVKVQNAKA